MNSRPLGFALITLLALAPATASANANEDAAAEAFASKYEVIAALVGAGASDAKLGEAIDGMFDYRALAEASLGGAENHAKVCGSRCAEFEALLTRLIRANYLRLARQIDAHPVEYVGAVEGRGGAFKVTTRVKVLKNGRERAMTVEYVMHRVGERWQIRDVITDDVSLVRTYRHEFAKVAKAEGIDGIIRRLDEKLGAG